MNAAKPKTRDRILASARELFFSKGLDETSIAEICKHSGVSNGSLFHHFPTKEAIALEIFVGIRRHYWEHVIAAMEAESTVPAAAEASVRAAFDFQKKFSDEYTFMLGIGGRTPVTRFRAVGCGEPAADGVSGQAGAA